MLPAVWLETEKQDAWDRTKLTITWGGGGASHPARWVNWYCELATRLLCSGSIDSTRPENAYACCCIHVTSTYFLNIYGHEIDP